MIQDFITLLSIASVAVGQYAIFSVPFFFIHCIAGSHLALEKKPNKVHGAKARQAGTQTKEEKICHSNQVSHC
jgi:hypothetical protein